MFNPSNTPTVSLSSAIVRVTQCSLGTQVFFSDKGAMDAYVRYVDGVAERRFPLANGGYLQGESIEQARDERGNLLFDTDLVDTGDGMDYVEVPRMVTYPWLRLKPAS